MKPTLYCVVRLAEKVAALAEQRVKKELTTLTKSGLLSTTEAKHVFHAGVREATRERKRVKQFILHEIKRELKKAQPRIKKLMAQKKQQFAAYRARRKR